MLARTDEFKEEIAKMGKQIDFRINLHINDRLITENGKFIMTENNNHILVEQFNEEDIDETLSGDSIFNVTISNKGTLLSTMMKEIDFEIREELRIGDIIDCSFGLKVGEEYEWINYGKYIIYSKEYNEDTNTYSYVSYDSMLLSMIEFDDRTLVENVSVKTAIQNICNKVGLSVNITTEDETNLPNLSKIIHKDTFKDIEMTYRDVLDMICQCLGVSMISDNKTLYLKYFNNTIVDEFDEEYLKDTNVTFGKVYGPINSLVLSRSEDNDNIYRKDEDSISNNGLHEFKIKDNLIMLYNDRENYIDEIFNQIKGVKYYENDFSSTGITYLEWLDYFNIIRGENTYKCLLLNDEIKLQQGLQENIYTEIPNEATTNYKIAGKTDKEVSFIVDKQNGKISSKVSQGDMESYVEQTASQLQSQITDNAGNISTLTQTTAGLTSTVATKVGNNEIISKINQSAEQIQINANKINLAGKTIYMTTDDIRIIANNFIVDVDGNLTCSNADVQGKITSSNGSIGGWDINSNGLSNSYGFYIKKATRKIEGSTYNYAVSNIYTMSDLLICQQILLGNIPTPGTDTKVFKHFDLNNNGRIDATDLLIIDKIVNDLY